MTLRRQIESCDANSAASLRELYGEVRNCPGLEIKLARLCADPKIESSASWLLKRRIECGFRPNRDLSDKLLRVFLDLNGWPARLHFLQIFHYLSIPPELKHPLREFVLELTCDRNKFIRAWSFSALHCIARAFPEFKTETSRLLRRAADSEAPSVKARLRNLPTL